MASTTSRALFTLILATIVISSEVVNIPGLGIIEGTSDDTHRSFKGVPYAAPPVGDLRWANPEPVPAWQPSIWDGTFYRPGCPQSCYLPPHTCPTVQSEDCLYLNIFTPLDIQKPAPVMIWIPGGNFQQGTSGTTLYDGRFIANTTGVIVITINYRLGALGWIATKDTLKGNYGFRDQRLAMKWVIKNIAAFGGNPSDITVVGQSAGASSIAGHLTSPYSRGLFQKAIIMSNPVTLPMKPLSRIQEDGATFLGFLKCEDNIECLRSKDVADIVAAEVKFNKDTLHDVTHILELFYPWTIAVDGDEVPQDPYYAFLSGNYHKIPTIIGDVSEEAVPFIYLSLNFTVNDAEYVAGLTAIFGLDAARVLEKYPPKPFVGDKRPQLAKLGTDYIFACSQQNATSAIASRSPGQVYYYEYAHPLSFDAWGPRYTHCIGHVCHGAELPILFHSANLVPAVGFNFTKDEDTLSKNLVTYFGNFIISGNPNKPMPVPLEWPLFNEGQRPAIVFDTPQVSLTSNWKSDTCRSLFDEIGYHHGY